MYKFVRIFAVDLMYICMLKKDIDTNQVFGGGRETTATVASAGTQRSCWASLDSLAVPLLETFHPLLIMHIITHTRCKNKRQLCFMITLNLRVSSRLRRGTSFGTSGKSYVRLEFEEFVFSFSQVGVTHMHCLLVRMFLALTVSINKGAIFVQLLQKINS